MKGTAEYILKKNTTKEFFLLYRVDGLHAIIVTDRDGVPVLKGEATSKYNSSLKCTFTNWKLNGVYW